MSNKIKIKRQDDSIYWIDHFDSAESMNRWIETEQTRPYWDQSFIIEKYEVNATGEETLLEE